MFMIFSLSTIVYLALVPFFSSVACSVHYIRVSVIITLICLILGTFIDVEPVDICHSFFHSTFFTIEIDSLLIAALVLIKFSFMAVKKNIKVKAQPSVFLIVVVCSILFAAYYLKVIKVLMFDYKTDASTGKVVQGYEVTMSPIHSYTMSSLTAFLTLFILDPNVIINCTELVALSIYPT